MCPVIVGKKNARNYAIGQRARGMRIAVDKIDSAFAKSVPTRNRELRAARIVAEQARQTKAKTLSQFSEIEIEALRGALKRANPEQVKMFEQNSKNLFDTRTLSRLQGEELEKYVNDIVSTWPSDKIKHWVMKQDEVLVALDRLGVYRSAETIINVLGFQSNLRGIRIYRKLK